MPDVRVFRNDGHELFADDPDTLEYIDPGVVLLYADTTADVVCTYFEGRLGQPIQGTVECTFADGIDLSAVRPALESVGSSGFSVSSASRENTASARWALDGLTEDPIRLGDPQRDAIRRLVESDDRSQHWRDWLPSFPFSGGQRALGDTEDTLLLAGTETDADAVGDGDDKPKEMVPRSAEGSKGNGGTSFANREVRADGTAAPSGETTLDFEVRSTYDAARFFAFLVDALADTGLTVAVSKAGRIDAVANANIVIQPDGDLPPGSRVEPLPDTRERLDVQRDAVARRSARDHLAAPVADLGEAFREATADPAVDDATGEAVLRDLLDTRLGRDSSLAVVDKWRARYRRARVAVVAALVGMVAGVLEAESIRLAGWRIKTAARSLATTDPTVTRAAVLDAIDGAGWLTMPAVSGLVLMAALAVRRRHQDERGDRDKRPSTARSDLLQLTLTAVIVVALLALFTSALLLWVAT
ncbi:hypothetical protein [Haloarchaeobius sp. DYHT-AS-18]|uniref:hypothetical protein n=1 Tax=Haloarchaeobius sp. DYHT-AS-18 TaxID=3446117 RepID=UPI003EB9EAFD